MFLPPQRHRLKRLENLESISIRAVVNIQMARLSATGSRYGSSNWSLVLPEIDSGGWFGDGMWLGARLPIAGSGWRTEGT